MKIKKHRIPVHEHCGFSIREVRPDYFMVDFMRDGKRERVCFKELIEAQRHCERAADKIKAEGTDTLILTAAQREDAIKALRSLKGKSSLQSAASYWMKHHGGEEGVTVAEAGRRWLDNLKVQGCRPTTIGERQQKLNRLIADMGERPIASVTRDEIEEWLTSKKLTGATWDGYRRAFRALWQYAAGKKLIEYNPVASIEAVRLDERLPRPFSVDAVRAIMQTAAQWAPAIVPTLAVQFFGGLRPGEAMGLDWSVVDFRQRMIRVLPEVSKVRRTRIVPMNAALMDWLLPYRKHGVPIGIQSKSSFSFLMHVKRIGKKIKGEKGATDTRPQGIAAAAGVDWIQDGPRKTFATAHFATYGDAAKLAGILGHVGGNDVLYRHYRGLMTKADARRYWKIRPASSNKVLVGNFKRAAG